jgi:hypothetical protein
MVLRRLLDLLTFFLMKGERMLISLMRVISFYVKVLIAKCHILIWWACCENIIIIVGLLFIFILRIFKVKYVLFHLILIAKLILILMVVLIPIATSISITSILLKMKPFRLIPVLIIDIILKRLIHFNYY